MLFYPKEVALQLLPLGIPAGFSSGMCVGLWLVFFLVWLSNARYVRSPEWQCDFGPHASKYIEVFSCLRGLVLTCGIANNFPLVLGSVVGGWSNLMLYWLCIPRHSEVWQKTSRWRKTWLTTSRSTYRFCAIQFLNWRAVQIGWKAGFRGLSPISLCWTWARFLVSSYWIPVLVLPNFELCRFAASDSFSSLI